MKTVDLDLHPEYEGVAVEGKRIVTICTIIRVTGNKGGGRLDA